MARRAKSEARIRFERRAKVEEAVRGLAAEGAGTFIRCFGLGAGGVLGLMLYFVLMGVLAQ